jgi:hypothetical protein
MARKSFVELLAAANAAFADNTSGAITPLALRTWISDLLTATQPGYAYLSAVPPLALTANIVPQVLPFAEEYVSPTNESVVSAAAGTIQRLERGTSVIAFNASVRAPNGRFISFNLVKDGVQTPWGATVGGAGDNHEVSVSFTAISYSDPAATYSISYRSEIDGVDIELLDYACILQINEVQSYT